jgi:hypothetical protein
MSTFCSHHHISGSAILTTSTILHTFCLDMRTEGQESPACNVIVKVKVNLYVRNHLRILKTSNRKEIQHTHNLPGDTVTCLGLAFRRKNLLSPRQMSPNRTSVQPLIMATLHTATDRFEKKKLGWVRKHWKWWYWGVRSRAITVSLQFWATTWQPQSSKEWRDKSVVALGLHWYNQGMQQFAWACEDAGVMAKNEQMFSGITVQII